MVVLTRRAAAVIEEARSSQGLPEHFGLRIHEGRTDEQEAGIRLDFTDVPVEGDQVLESEGTNLFVAPELVEPLAEVAIDTEPTQAGTKLVLRPQAEM